MIEDVTFKYSLGEMVWSAFKHLEASNILKLAPDFHELVVV